MKIDRRRCVVWNEDIGSHGAWDATKCTTVLTNKEATLCECATFGTFSLIAEMTQAPSYPPEYTWLIVIKYIGYIVSIVLITIFITLVVRVK